MTAAPRPLRAAACWALLCALALGSAARVRDWRTDAALWTDAARKAPCAIRPALQAAYALGAEGNAEGVRWFARAERLAGGVPCAR